MIFNIPFASLKAQTSYEKNGCAPPHFVLISSYGTAIYYRAREEEWRNLFRPRMIICAVILTSTNKWDIEPVHLSLVIKPFNKTLDDSQCCCSFFITFKGGVSYDEVSLPHLLWS